MSKKKLSALELKMKKMATLAMAKFACKPTSANSGHIATFSGDGNLQDSGKSISDLQAVMGASGSNHKSGLVPDTPSTAGTSKYLREDGTWAEPSGGNVMGASGSSHASGLTPDTPSTAGTTKFLREDGTWQVPAYPTTLPASDVYSWAKGPTKPTYIMSEVASISAQAITTNTSSSCSITGAGNAGKSQTIIYTNSTGSDLTVTVPTTYSTPDGQAIELTCKAGGYCEVNYLNVGGTIFARGL